MAIKATGKKDMSNRELAKLFDVDESTVRYHVARSTRPDGRSNKPQKADQLAGVICYWLDQNKPEPGRKPNARALWEYLVDGYGYTGKLPVGGALSGPAPAPGAAAAQTPR